MRSDTNASRAYQHLRDQLVAGKFAPGTRLLYGPIGREIGVSATPVREAAGRLANEGLVDLVPNLGAIVRTLGKKDLTEIYEVRELLEPYAAGLTASRANDDQIEQIAFELSRMRKIADELSGSQQKFADDDMMAQFDNADYLFHVKINEATGNSALIRTASQSHVLTHVFGIRPHRHDSDTMQETCDDHERIINAIRERNPEAAKQAAADHIRRGLQSSLANCGEQEDD